MAPKGMPRAMASTTAHIDRVLAHLSRIIATSSGTDTLLQTLQYTLLVLHTQLSRFQNWRIRLFVLAIARKASKTVLPGETVLATMPSTTYELDGVIAGSKALSDLISDFRIFTRLWGLLGVYDWAKSTWYSPPEDRLIRATVWAQVLAGIGFQWYENVAYLAMKGVLRGERFNSKKQSVWWEWSSRFWMAHVALEVLRLLRVWQLESAETKGDDSLDKRTKRVEASTAWRRALIINTAWAPITAHYSWEQGCISDQLVGLLGTVASGLGCRQLWKRTT